MAWLYGYDYRKQVTLNGSSTSAQADYQLPVEVRFDKHYIACDGDGWVVASRNTPSSCYYNGYTYVVYQGKKSSLDGDPYITRYCHATGEWDAPVRVGINNAYSGYVISCPVVLVRADTGHVGKIMVVWGGCSEGGSYADIRWAESSNAEDISSWGAAASVGLTDGIWYSLIQAGSGDIYLFACSMTTWGQYERGYIKMVAGGSSWGSATHVLDFSTPYTIVSGAPAYDSSAGIFYFPILAYDTGIPAYTYLYLIGFKPSDGKVYDIAGNSFTLPVTKSTLDNASYKFQVFAGDSTYQTRHTPSVDLDSSGYPHMTYMYTADGGTNWNTKYIYWTGSAWSSPTSVTDAISQFTTHLFWNGTDDIDVFGAESDDGDYCKFHWNGATWAKTVILAVSSEPDTLRFTNTCRVKDYNDTLKVLWCTWDSASTRIGQRLYAYGDSGFVNWKADGYVTLDGHTQSDFDDLRFTKADGETINDYWIEEKVDYQYAKCKVEIKDTIPQSGSVQPYAYYGKADATAGSDITETMLGGNDGVDNNLTENVAGSSTVSESGGEIVVAGGDGATDGWVFGKVQSDVFFAEVKSISTGGSSGTDAAFHVLSLVDSASVPSPMAAASWNPLNRFYIQRYGSNHATHANEFRIIYGDALGTSHFWDGNSWELTATYFGGAGTYYVQIWDDGTNFKADILDSNRISILTAVASIAKSSVKAFSSGRVLVSTEPYSDAYYINTKFDNWYARKYVSPEPTWGTVGSEEAILHLSLAEGLKGGDSPSSLMTASPSLADGFKGGDSPLAAMIASPSLIDGFLGGDVPSGDGVMSALLSDGLKFSEDILAEIIGTILLSLTEGITLGESDSPTLQEYYNTGEDSATTFGQLNWEAQTFTPTISHRITSVKLLLYKVVGTVGTVTVGIRATDENGHPTGSDLCSGTTDGDTIPTNYAGEWREITLGSGYNLSAGTKYAIVIRAPNASSISSLGWRNDISSPTHEGGWWEYSLNGGDSWLSHTYGDFMFEEYGAINTPLISLLAYPSLAEGIKHGDSPVASLLASLLLTEGVSLGDAALLTLSLYLALADGTKLGDSPLAVIIQLLSVIEGLKHGDSASLTMTAAPSLSEGVKLGEVLTALADMQVSITDGIKFSDVKFVVLTGGLLYLSLTEGFKYSDSHSATMLANAQLSDGTKLGDVLSILSTLQITEGMKLGDTTLAQLVFVLSITEGVKFGDAASLSALMNLTLTDGTKLGDMPVLGWLARLLIARTFTRPYFKTSTFTRPYFKTWTKTGGG